jgi:hypothetical protein
MQLDKPHLELYQQKAPELLDAVTTFGDGNIMKRDEKTDFCVKLGDDGWCNIHKERGEDFLGDACHFYPRTTRALGDNNIMSGMLSCPEFARIALSESLPVDYSQANVERLPYSLKNYLPEGLESSDVYDIHHKFLEYAHLDTIESDVKVRVILSVCRSLDNIPPESWKMAVPFYLKSAVNMLPEPEFDPIVTHRLLLSLGVIIKALKNRPNTRLLEAFTTMEQLLGVKLDWENMNLLSSHHQTTNQCRNLESPMLSRWLRAHIEQFMFPFAAPGISFYEKAQILMWKYAIVKLGFQASSSEDDFIKAAQSLSRFYDHLEDISLLRIIMDENNWSSESELAGII